MELYFLSRLDSVIFKRFNATHQAITGVTSVCALIGGAVISLIVFALQMFNANNTLIEVIAGIGMLALLGWIVKVSLPALMAFSTWTSRIVYGLYILLLSSLCFMIAMWMVMIALVLLVIYGIFKIFFSGSSDKSKARVIFSDGSEKEAKKTGKGICGETYYEDEDGHTYVKP